MPPLEEIQKTFGVSREQAQKAISGTAHLRGQQRESLGKSGTAQPQGRETGGFLSEAQDKRLEALVISSQNAKDKSKEEVAEINTLVNRLREADALARDRAKQRKEEVSNRASRLSQSDFTEQELRASGADMSEFIFDPETGTFSQGTTDSTTRFFMDQVKKSDRQVEKLVDELEDLERRSDQINASIASNIRKKYENLREEQRDIGNRALAQVQKTNIRFGTERYAPLVATGIVSAQETANLKAIREIQQEEESLILSAKQAELEGDFTAVHSRMKLAEETREKKQKALEKHLNLMQEKSEEIAEKNRKISRESTIIDLMDQGVTDPVQIFDFLNFDEEGNQVGDVSLEEINEALDVAQGGGVDTTGDIRQFEDAKRLGLIPPNMQLFDFIARKSAAGRKPESGGGDEGADFNLGREIIKENPGLTRLDLEQRLQEETDLTDSEISNLIDTNVGLDEMTINAIAEGYYKASGEGIFTFKDKEVAKNLIESQDTISVKRGGKAVSFDLTSGDKQKIKKAIDDL